MDALGTASAGKATMLDEDALTAAVRRIKIESPKLTAKEVFEALVAEGEMVELAAVKKTCGKVTKALAKEPPPPPPPSTPTAKAPRKERRATSTSAMNTPPTKLLQPRKEDELAEFMRLRMQGLPPLVKPPNSAQSVAFLRCQVCEVRVAEPTVCSGCLAVCYCSQMCQVADAAHEADCAAFARHMTTDVRVRLVGVDEEEPSWVRVAMDHRCEMSWCELLERLGVHEDPAYGLLCGCTMPGPTPVQVCEGVEAQELSADAPPLTNWAAYYAARTLLPLTSPRALLLTWPLTVYLALSILGLTTCTEREIVVHYLGPEKEVMMLPLFAELAVLCPALALRVEMIGPLGIALPPPMLFEGAHGGHVSVSVRRGLYHTLDLPSPDLAVAPNAGLSIEGYADRWPPTLYHIQQRRIPFLFTDYSEQSVEKAIAFAERRCGLTPSIGVTLNPFRQPLRLPCVNGGSVGHPTLSNGFYAAFNLTGPRPKPAPAAEPDVEVMVS